MNLDENNYIEYLKKINEIYNQDNSLETCIHLLFSVNNEKCELKVTLIVNDYSTEVLHGIFDYNNKFKKDFLIPAIVGFSKRNPLGRVDVFPNPRKTSVYYVTSYSKNNNVLTVENISESFALQIENNIKKIPAVYFNIEKLTNNEVELEKENSGGFAGIIGLSIIVVLVCIVIGILLTLELF